MCANQQYHCQYKPLAHNFKVRRAFKMLKCILIRQKVQYNSVKVKS